MQFLYPSFLFSLVALAIPIIIHLFYFRRFKKVYFTNVRFLKEVKDETSSRRKLRNLLVLLARCLAVAMLVFAFAQPFIPKDVEVKQGENAVSIFIDNSFSMSALSEDAPLVEKAKKRAKEIISAYAIEDRFQVLTNDFEGKHQRLVSKEEAIGLVEEIKVSPAVRTLSQILTRQKQALGSGTGINKLSYVISDFQKNISDLENFKDTLLSVNLVPLQAVQEKNVSIDSAWFEAPVQMLSQPNPLVVKVKNWSTEAAENVRLTVKYDGETKPVGELSIPGSSTMLDTVMVTIQKPGWHLAELSLTDYPVQFDDHFYFAYNVAELINVLVINELTPSPYLEAAFKGLSFFNIVNQSVSQITYSKFPTYQLIVVNGVNSVSSGLAQELRQYVTNGGNVLVFPSNTANTATYNAFLSSIPANELLAYDQQERNVSDVNTEEFVFQDVFENKSANLKLPITKGNYKLSTIASRGEEKLLTYRDGSTFLGKFKSGQGMLYLCPAPLNTDVNNLVNSGEIFIPMLYKMAISSARKRKISYTIGRDETIESDNLVKGGESVYKMRGEAKQGKVAEEFIPQQRIVGSKVFIGLQNQITEAGYYDLFLKPDSTLAKFAFNYDRRESDLSYLSNETLKEKAGNNVSILTDNASASLEGVVNDRSKGVVLWKWCVIIALLALAVEVLLLRFWKV
ncbi:MAG: BatA domain-containing protein [Saprospiraceae bacterium]|nr:BatA domain-containing protein [Saprospiraceae bacterium]MCF8248507.1 BatA domain-containing protein [Saprospiraceae bacterium]MCF8280578.1 BatA domain-containing protein [Bacteroidales bacterium]MCF8310241.1 BatA domain-containing protein [Saprospiraceae bacterium]MCF8439320.1 BatA domain-containing protein [Saprospiraceae bacterium]